MWKVGQEVWCVAEGHGFVKARRDAAHTFPLLIRFDTGRDGLYTEEGKMLPAHPNRSLFFSEPKVEGATEPPFEPTLKKGDKVFTVHKEHPGWASGGKVATFGVVYQEHEKSVILSDKGLVSFPKDKYIIYKVGEPLY